jgi:hypothetical protein
MMNFQHFSTMQFKKVMVSPLWAKLHHYQHGKIQLLTTKLNNLESLTINFGWPSMEQFSIIRVQAIESYLSHYP